MRSVSTRNCMKTCFALAAAVILIVGPTGQATAQTAKKKPNVVIIVTDDHGWNDIGYHNKEVKTPNLDKLAANGVRLNRYYTYPVCSLTRAALLTGLSTSRTGVNNRTGLDLKYHILPESLKAAGYATWMIGKWHLGGTSDNTLKGEKYYPQNRGFDYFYGHLHGAIDYSTHFRRDLNELDWQRNGAPVKEQGYSTDLMANDAVAKIKSREKSTPFLLYLCFNAVHGPIKTPPSGLGGYANLKDSKRATLLANVTYMDAAIGRVLAALDEEGITEDTLIIFVSDNGGQLSMGSSNFPLRGEKGTVFEGGTRVPAIICWPGTLKGGVICQQVIGVMDLFPTIAEAIGVKPGNKLPFDGKSRWKHIRDGKVEPPDGLVIASGREAAILHGPWKMIQNKDTNETLLFRIEEDPTESTNVAAANPEVVRDLAARMKKITDLSPKKNKGQ